MTQAEADKINAAGAPVFEDGVYYGGGKQLGPGVYTSPYPGAWKQIKGKWYAEDSILCYSRIMLILLQGVRHLHRL